MDRLVSDDGEISNYGERAIVRNSFLFWAHLSIYWLGASYAKGKRVLDVGSGSGYGASYLARHGAASVEALEGSPDAVEHSRRRYAGDGVRYQVADLNEPLPFPAREFGFVFSSNVFEHVANVDGLAAECARVMEPDGVLLVAVPPIFDAATMAIDIDNEHHVHHLPPTAWNAKLRRFFEDVNCHAHLGANAFADPAVMAQEMARPEGRATIRETDFAFPQTTPEDLMASRGSITAIFVCRRPRAVPLPETLAERTPAEWHEGAVAARALAAARAARPPLGRRIRGTALWRLTRPLRRLVRHVREG